MRVLFCCIFTPVERSGRQPQIPSVIFGARGNIVTVVIHPAPDRFTWLPSNNLPNAVQLLLCRSFLSFFFLPTFIFFPPKATGSGGGAGETNQGDYRTEGGQRQEVAPEGELDETEGDLYTRAVFEQTELRSGSEKRD